MLSRTMVTAVLAVLLIASAARATPRPQSTVDQAGASSPDARTVPFWRGAFTFGGATFPYEMVGTDAFTSDASTTVPSAIVPLRLHFTASGQDTGGFGPALDATLDGSSRVAATIASPIFTRADYPLSRDRGQQYASAIQRAEFNRIGSRYEVNLGAPSVLPAATLDVPANKGFAVQAGDTLGMVDYSWFTTKIRSLLNTLDLDPSTLPIVIDDNVALSFGASCCALGYHGEGPKNCLGVKTCSFKNAPMQTYVVAAYLGARSATEFWRFPLFQDVFALSHEVVEWMNDPFGDNIVPTWSALGSCSNLLEVADPVVTAGFTLPGNPDRSPEAGGEWHLQDEAFLPWFAHQVPSTAFDGRYTYLGTFTSPSTLGC